MLFGHAEDSGALARGGEGAGVVASEEAVAEAGDNAVAELAQGAGDEAQDFGEGPPGAADELKGCEGGVGAVIEAFVGDEGVGDEDDAVGEGGEVEALKRTSTI